MWSRILPLPADCNVSLNNIRSSLCHGESRLDTIQLRRLCSGLERGFVGVVRRTSFPRDRTLVLRRQMAFGRVIRSNCFLLIDLNQSSLDDGFVKQAMRGVQVRTGAATRRVMITLRQQQQQPDGPLSPKHRSRWRTSLQSVQQGLWGWLQSIIPAKNRDLRADLGVCLWRLGRIMLLCLALLFVDVYLSLTALTVGLCSTALFVLYPNVEETWHQWIARSSFKSFQMLRTAFLACWREWRRALMDQLRKLLE